MCGLVLSPCYSKGYCQAVGCAAITGSLYSRLTWRSCFELESQMPVTNLELFWGDSH